MSDIVPLDVAVCDADRLWRVDHLNALHSLNVRGFRSVVDAVTSLTPGHKTVIVVGPGDVELGLDALPPLIEDHPEWVPLFVLDHEPPSTVARVERMGANVVVDGSWASGIVGDAVGDAVRALLPPSAPRPASTATRLTPLVRSGRTRSTNLSPQRTRGKVIVVTSAKAGEGATSVAINLAAALARDDAGTVALVETDAEFGDMSLLLGLPGRAHVGFDKMNYDADFVEQLSAQHVDSGTVVVRPPIDPSGQRMPPIAAIKFINSVASQAALVVVDIPFDLMESTGIAPFADVVVLVTSPGVTSRKNALIASTKLGRPRNLRLVINHASRRGAASDARDVRQALHSEIAAVLPYEPKLDSSRSLSPRVLAPTRSKFGRVVTQLAGELQATFARMQPDTGTRPPAVPFVNGQDEVPDS